MTPLPWIIDIPIPQGSPTRVVRHAEVMEVFRALARARLNVTDGDVSETPDGVAIHPRIETSTTRRGLTITPTNSGIIIEPCYFAGFMPEIGGVPLNNDPPPVLFSRTNATLGAWFEMTAELVIEGGFRPVGIARSCEIGWDTLHNLSEPSITWETAITDSPPQMDGVAHHVDDGRWFIPIAYFTKNGIIIPLLTVEPSSFMNVRIDFATRHW